MEPELTAGTAEVISPDRAAENFCGINPIRSGSERLVASLACAACFLAIFSWLATEIFTGHLENFDAGARSLVHQATSPALTAEMYAATFLGSFQFLAILFVVILAAAFLLRLRRQAAWFAIAVIGELVLEITLKSFYHRPRPQSFFVTDAPGFSFPSGHALGSFCFYGAAAGLACACINARWLRVCVWTASIALILAIGLSRIYLGVHYPSDVIAGYLAGAVWLSTLLSAARARRLNRTSAPEN